MKKIVGTVVIVVVVAIGAPYGFGIQAKHEYERTVGLIAETSQLPFKVIDYKRGLFSSTAVTAVTINKMTLKIMHKIQHGPIFFDASQGKPNGLEFGAALVHNDISFDPEIPELTNLQKALGGKKLLIWKFIVGFTGGMKTILYSPPFEYTSNDGMLISWKGMDEQIVNDKRYKAFNGFVKFPGIAVKSDEFKGGFSEGYQKFDYKQAQYNLWVGDGLSSVEKMELAFPTFGLEKTYVFDKVKMHLSTEMNNALYQGKLNFSLNKAQTPMGMYGPVAIGVKLLNLDPEGISMIQNKMKNKEVSPSFQDLKPAIRKVLLKTPTVVIEGTKLTLPEGDVSVDAKMSVGGPNIEENFDNAIYTTTLEGDVKAIIAQAVLKKFLGMGMEREVKAKPDVAVLSPAEQTLQLDKEVMVKVEKLKAIGLVSEQDQNFEVKFSIEHGKVMVNGKELNLNSL